MVEANFALPLKLKGREKGEFLEIQRLSNVYIYVYSFLPVEIEGNDVPRILRARRNRYSNDSLIFNLLTETNSE